MAKVFTMWLMLVYAFSATGASVHLHYCCGKLQHLAMEHEHASGSMDCTLCLQHHENKRHNTCDSNHQHADAQPHNHCQDIQIDAQKTTGDHLPSSDKNLLKIHALELLVFTLIYVVDFPQTSIATAEIANAPPYAGTTPLFIRHCNYRI